MAQTSRVLEASLALSQALTANSIPHAFHGSVLIAMVSNSAMCNVSTDVYYSQSICVIASLQEVQCIVEGGAAVHPFGRVRQAIEGHPSLKATNSPWTNR